MEFTRWMPLSELYHWTFSQTPADIRVTRLAGAWRLLAQAGIYVIADPALAGTWPGSKIIYIGSAGGKGAGSTFHDRVHKHALKAMNATADVVPGNGISDTERWRQYRETRGLAEAPVATWIVRFLVLPNATIGERAAILFAEDAIALAFDRRHHVGAERITMPRCNSQSLGDKLLHSIDELLDRPQHEAPHAVEAPVTQVTIAQPVAQPVENVVEAAIAEIPDQVAEPLMNMNLPPDDASFDEQFEQRLGPVLAAHYPALLAELQAVCESPHGLEVGLRVYYTNTSGRDLRVEWDIGKPVSVLLVIGKAGSAFFGFTRAPAADLPAGLPLQEIDQGKFRRYQAGGAEFVSNVGELLRAALAWASAEFGV